MKSGMIIALVAVVAIALIARGCSERKEDMATKVEATDNAAIGGETQPAEFSLSAKDDEGFDLPEREEIRQKRRLTPGTEVFVVGAGDFKVDTSSTYAFVIGIDGQVKVETADTDIAEVLVVRSTRKREDLQRQKVEISNDKNLFIRVGDAEAPDSIHEARKRIERMGKRLPEISSAPDPIPEIRHRVALRLPRQANLEIREIGGDVMVGEIGGQLEIAEVIGNVRAARVAGLVVVGDVNGDIDMTFAPLRGARIKIGGEVNGNVDLRFEGEVNADLNASNVIGAIKPDFPKVEIRRTNRGWWWASLKARIGVGGPVIEVHDVNGNVTLSKAGNAAAARLKAVAK